MASLTASKKAYLQGRLNRVEAVRQDLGYAIDNLETGVIEGDFRNDSPELTSALKSLRDADNALRDLELFVLSTLRETGQ